MNAAQAAVLLKRLAARSLRRKPMNSSTEIRLTRLCTQRCRQCSVYEKKTRPATMSLDRFRHVASALRDYGAYIGFISGGEATLVPHLDQILIEAKKTFQISTTLVTGLYNSTEIIQRAGRLALDMDINIQTSLDGMGPLGDNLRGVPHFSDTVLGHMKWLSGNRGRSRSLLYANIVINNLNLEQVPELIKQARDLGWRTTVGLYHSLTDTTRTDDELRIRPGKRLDTLLAFLDNNPDILNLNQFVRGIRDFADKGSSDICAFLDAPVLATRTTIMEDGALHLCWGDPVGNVFRQTLAEIFDSPEYRERLGQYRNCSGCWTTCYTQRYLLIHPGSVLELMHNIRKVRSLNRH